MNKLLNVLNSPRTWNGRPASAEYFADAALKKFKSEINFKSNTVILEIGKNNIIISDNERENVSQLTLKDTFEDFLKSLGR